MFGFDVRDRGRGELEEWKRWVAREARASARTGDVGERVQGRTIGLWAGGEAGEGESEAGARDDY